MARPCRYRLNVGECRFIVGKTTSLSKLDFDVGVAGTASSTNTPDPKFKPDANTASTPQHEFALRSVKVSELALPLGTLAHLLPSVVAQDMSLNNGAIGNNRILDNDSNAIANIKSLVFSLSFFYMVFVHNLYITTNASIFINDGPLNRRVWPNS